MSTDEIVLTILLSLGIIFDIIGIILCIKWREKYDMKKELKLCWKVYCPETCYVGRPKILEQNIFELNWPMNGRLYELRKEKDKSKFEHGLSSEIGHELYSRAEYESYVSPMFSKDDEDFLQIDPFKQVHMNWEQFVDYCWANKKLFRQFKKQNKRLKEMYRERCNANR